MPNRIIKESLCYSEDIDQLSAFEETVFVRLIVNVDDYGRVDARPSFLKSKLFVTKQGITEKNVKDALQKLASIGLVRLYEVDGKPFLLFPKWSSHQRIRDTKAKYPAPISENDVSPQIAADCGGLPPEYNPIHNPNPNPESETKSQCAALPPFDAFWAIYPRKDDKCQAYKKYQARLKDGYSELELLSAAKAYADRCRREKTEQKYIKQAKTFLGDATPFSEYLPKQMEPDSSPQEKCDPFAEAEREWEAARISENKS